MAQTSLQDLRRIADTVDRLKGREILDASMRSDLRQLKVEMSGGLILVIALESEEPGRARLEVDVVRQPDDVDRQQLEVRFDTAV